MCQGEGSASLPDPPFGHPATPPGVPTDLKLETPDGGGIILNWKRAAKAADYQIWRKENTEASFRILANFKPADRKRRLFYTDTSAASGKTYHYYIIARKSGLSSAPSNTHHPEEFFRD